MPRFRMCLGYDGTAYLGWQIQPHGPTIQGQVQRALSKLAKTGIHLVGSGRTDAGVHARAQIAHFDLERPIPLDGLRRGLNALLPRDIRVMELEEANPDFHARYDALSKVYRYTLDRGPVANPWTIRFALHYPYPMDRDAIEEAAAMFVGEHDFAGFRGSSCSAKTTVRRVSSSKFIEAGSELIYEVQATGFLHHMVRTMMGSLLEVGRAKMRRLDIQRGLEAPDRSKVGATAPPHGLALHQVYYR